MTSIRALPPPEPDKPLKRLAAEQVAAFQDDGFLLLPGLFASDEVALVQDLLRHDSSVGEHSVGIIDSSGAPAEIFGWSGASEDVLGAFVRIARLVEAAEDLLGGQPVYHWHSKLSMKRPGSAGRWDWHQDFGSWYREGCLRPEMLTAMVAVDRTTPENGCVQLLRGSHRLGRIDHVPIGPSHGADPAVVARALEALETVACVMEPGDVVFFHGNTLHASGGNTSETSRTLLHVSYNTVRNQPTDPLVIHAFEPLEVLPDDALLTGAFAPRLDQAALTRRIELRRKQKIGEVYGYQVAGPKG
ncbi:MAG: phytanoyl-CoA dioxygenase family protein [Kiloniellales bacterium]|nr:phytanoyl-CoA dioxygenase family protein [Kiloniellales bacterium]